MRDYLWHLLRFRVHTGKSVPAESPWAIILLYLRVLEALLSESKRGRCLAFCLIDNHDLGLWISWRSINVPSTHNQVVPLSRYSSNTRSILHKVGELPGTATTIPIRANEIVQFLSASSLCTVCPLSCTCIEAGTEWGWLWIQHLHSSTLTYTTLS